MAERSGFGNQEGEGDSSPHVYNTVQGDVSGVVFQIGSLYLPAPEPTRRTPRSIDAGRERLVNREQELALLDEVMERAESASGPVVAVLTGLHGVGKTAVGRHWSVGVRERFDGGDLFGDFSKRRWATPVDVADLLGEFIRELGSQETALPPTLEDRRGLFKDLTASRRFLLLLDDVSDAAQVKALLPTGPGSVVVVTSNSHLEELLYEGAELVSLDPLDAATARRLLARTAGQSRLDREAEATEELVALCGGLPITLCVCAAGLRINRHSSVAAFVEEIRKKPRLLGALSGKGETSIEAVFDFGYRQLAPPEALLYRRLGLHPGVDFGPVQAMVLADAEAGAVEASLEVLVDRHLVEPRTVERMRFHELVRLHALACAEADEGEGERDAALRRLVDWYYAALRKADRTLTADRLRLSDEERIETAELPSFSDRSAVFVWLEDERPNIVAVFHVAVEHEWDDRIWQMAEALWLFFYNRKPFADWIAVMTAAIESSRRLGDRAVEARTRSWLARAHMDLGDKAAADRELRVAEEAVLDCDHETLMASIREFRGAFYEKYGRYDQAVEEFERARRVFGECGEDRGVAIQNYHIGLALTKSGRAARAVAPLEEGLATMRAFRDEINTARTLLHLGRAKVAVGRMPEAVKALEEAIAISSRLGVRHTEGEAFEELAAIADEARQGDHAHAFREHAYLAFREISHPRAEELAAQIGIG